MNSEVSRTKNKFVFFTTSEYYLIIILFAAVLIRIIFFNGLVFSDDSYYSRLAFLNNNYDAQNYLGYPILLIRKLSTLFTFLSFKLLGYNEIASIAFPFILSLSSIILIYKIAELLTNDFRISLAASFLYAFFPVDIIFASINFADLQCVFFINLAVYLLLKSINEQKAYLSALAGISLAISLLFKEYAYYYCIILLAVIIYQSTAQKKINLNFVLPLFAIVVFFFAEGLVYLLTKNDFMYRLHILKQNYIYCYYDFFPYVQSINSISRQDYYYELLKHIGNNLRYVFIRRYYLLLPFCALLQAIIATRKKDNIFLIVWFWGLLILLPLATVSFSLYSPVELRRVWYIYPLIFPFCILTAQLIYKLKKYAKFVFMLLYLSGSILMSLEFRNFFDIQNKNRFKRYAESNLGNDVHTDHHTAYGLQLIYGYKEPDRLKIFTNTDSLFCKKGDLLIVSRIVLDELKKQGYHFPVEGEINPLEYKLISSIGQFQTYEKLN